MLLPVILISIACLASASVCPTVWQPGSLSISLSGDGQHLLINTSGCPPYDWTSQSTNHSATVSHEYWMVIFPVIESEAISRIDMHDRIDFYHACVADIDSGP